MSNTKYNTGDIVQLKSGGPKMTVVECTPGGEVHCFWFGGNKRERGAFPPDTLKRIETEKQSDK